MSYFCSLQQASNAGFGPSAVDPRKCITISCPNSTTTPTDSYFEVSKWGSNINNSCMKPLADAQVSKQYRCDERWYDWFSVPNYHLGNGYVNPDLENPGICYNPCLSGSLPAFLTDPIDGETLHFMDNDENVGNCISRQDYFGGKYSEGSDYCPLSWIYIINSTPTTLQDLIKKQNNTFANTEMANNHTTTAFGNNQTNALVYANNIQKLLPTELNNIGTPSRIMQNACNRIQTKSRVSSAYQMCSNLMINEKSYNDRFAQSLPQNFANNKVTMMKQACNAVFCNVRDPAASSINKNPLCFKNVGTFDPSTGEVIDRSKERLIAPQPIPQKKFMYNSIKTAIYLVLVPLLAYLLYILLTDFLLPYIILPIYVKILIFFKYVPPNYADIVPVIQLTRKLKKAEKQCNSQKEKFILDNKKLRENNLPTKPSEPIPQCDIADKIRAELNSSAAESSSSPAAESPAADSGAPPAADSGAKPAASGAKGLLGMMGMGK